jgi:hypothetical protein
LPGFDRSRWQHGPLYDNVHMGAPRDYDQEGKDPNWAAPNEPAAAGCPGAWYRTAFVRSLLRYYRRSDGNGGRVENPELADCKDPLIREAIREIENQEDAAAAEHYEADRKYRAKG